MSVYCQDCANVHLDTRGEEPWRWRCARVAVAAGFKFVSQDHSPYPPFERCDRVNIDGNCQMFAPVRTPPGDT